MDTEKHLAFGRRADFQYDIFISYRRRDAAVFASWLRKKLSSIRIPASFAGLDPLRIYLDVAHDRVTPDFWNDNIARALRKSRFLLIVVTPSVHEPDTPESPNWVRREIGLFASLEQQANLIVVLPSEVLPKKAPAPPLPEEVSRLYPRLHYVEFQQAVGWTLLRRPTGFFERHEGLVRALSSVAGAPLDIAPEAMPAFREEQERARVRRLTLVIAGLTAVTLALIGVTVWAVTEQSRALRGEAEATKQRDIARANERTAKKEKARADEKTSEALTNLELAQARERMARSRALVIRAGEERAHPETSLLLGLAAIRTDRTFEAESGLLGTLLLYPRLQSSLYAWHDAGSRTVETMAYSPDGREMAVGYADGALVVRNQGQGDGVYLLQPGAGSATGIAAVVFSPDSRFLAAALPEGKIRIWDRRSKREIPAIRTAPPAKKPGDMAPRSRPEALAFDPRTGLLAAGQADGRIRLWNIQNGQANGAEFGDPIPEEDYHNIGVVSLAFAADGSFLVSGHGGNATSLEGDASFRLWQAQDGYRSGRTLTTGLRNARAIAIHPRKNLVAIGGSAHDIEIIDVKSDHLTLLRRGAAGDVIGDRRLAASALAFNSTGELLASGYGDGRIALWDDPANSQPLDLFASGPAGSAGALSFVPQSGMLATGGADGVVRLWRTTPEPAGEPLGATDHLYAAALSPDGKLLATAGVAGKLRWWDLDRRKTIAEYSLGTDNMGRSNDGRAIGFLGNREVLILISSGALFRCNPARCVDMARRIESAANYRGLRSASFVPGARFWFEWRERPYRCSISTGCERLPGKGNQGSDAGAVNSDGTRWATPGWEEGRGTLALCEKTGCRELDTGSGGPSNSIMGVQFDPSGSLLVAGTGEGRVVFFDGRTGARLGPPVQAHSGGVEFLAFSRDGRTMASGGRGGTVVLWNVAARQPIGAPFPRPGINQVSALLFHPDGKRLFVQYSERGRMVLLDTDLKTYWESRACRAASRELTPEEWRADSGNAAQVTGCKGLARPPVNWEVRPPAPF